MRLYAAAGVAEYWIIDVDGKAVEIYREPSDERYLRKRIAHAGESVAPLAFPGCTLAVGEIVGLGKWEERTGAARR